MDRFGPLGGSSLVESHPARYQVEVVMGSELLDSFNHASSLWIRKRLGHAHAAPATHDSSHARLAIRKAIDRRLHALHRRLHALHQLQQLAIFHALCLRKSPKTQALEDIGSSALKKTTEKQT